MTYSLKVSIHMITFNHEKFIAQAIDSVLMQQTTFDYELVIGEDCSTDHTRDIIIEYQKKYPDKIHLILPEKNLGMLPNFVGTYKACKGQYIALLEGDDYWTDPLKLQKQIDFLDANPEFVICFHNAKLIYEDVIKSPKLFNPPNQKSILSMKDFFFKNHMVTCSVVFRNGLIKEFPDWFYVIKIGDIPLHILNARFGKIGYLKDVMGVYRVHNGGVWSGISIQNKHLNTIEMYSFLDTYLNYKYSYNIKAGISRLYYFIAMSYANEGNLIIAKQFYKKGLKEFPLNPKAPMIGIISLTSRIYFPWTYAFLKFFYDFTYLNGAGLVQKWYSRKK